MPTINRRRAFLAGLTAAVATPTVVAPVAAAQVPTLQEVPEIIEIGQRLHGLLEAARAAEARKAEARAIYESSKPAVPKQLVVGRGEHPWRDTTEDEVDVDNQMIPDNGRFPARRIYRSRNLKAFLVRWGDDLQPDDAKRLRKLARIARRHERADAEALALSGYMDRKAGLRQANEALDEQVDRLLELEPVTMAGLVVYARAISACRDTSGLGRVGDNQILRLLEADQNA